MKYMPIPEKLKKHRDVHGLSRFALSKKAGMGNSALYRIETGITPTVHHLSADAIARALDCKVEDIFTPINKGV